MNAPVLIEYMVCCKNAIPRLFPFCTPYLKFRCRLIGFFDECKRRYNIKLWKTFTDCFNCLPIAAIIDEKIFCCHGGLSPDLQDMEQIRRIVRPTDVPDTGLLCDLLWSDPDKEVKVSEYMNLKILISIEVTHDYGCFVFHIGLGRK